MLEYYMSLYMYIPALTMFTNLEHSVILTSVQRRH